jgi:hypothetical protein
MNSGSSFSIWKLSNSFAFPWKLCSISFIWLWSNKQYLKSSQQNKETQTSIHCGCPCLMGSHDLSLWSQKSGGWETQNCSWPLMGPTWKVSKGLTQSLRYCKVGKIKRWGKGNSIFQLK